MSRTGSCNITPKAFGELGELCVAVNNDNSPFARQVRASAEELFKNAVRIGQYEDIRYDHFMAAVEAAVMR